MRFAHTEHRGGRAGNEHPALTSPAYVLATGLQKTSLGQRRGTLAAGPASALSQPASLLPTQQVSILSAHVLQGRPPLPGPSSLLNLEHSLCIAPAPQHISLLSSALSRPMFSRLLPLFASPSLDNPKQHPHHATQATTAPEGKVQWTLHLSSDFTSLLYSTHWVPPNFFPLVSRISSGFLPLLLSCSFLVSLADFPFLHHLPPSPFFICPCPQIIKLYNIHLF